MFGIFQSTTIPALEQSLAFSQRRHELLAGNIANMDTPGYRQKDLDETQFQNTLADSIRSASDPDPLAMSPATRDDMYSGPRAATEQIVFHDGSDVSLERQVTEIAKNQHLHGLAVTTMRSQFALLRAAITERA
jgi:flagellar basal-body rod protein FlgB